LAFQIEILTFQKAQKTEKKTDLLRTLDAFPKGLQWLSKVMHDATFIDVDLRGSTEVAGK
jgi:hypothetical protein